MTAEGRPLDGYRVVEVASWFMVPSGAGVLAEWGADVVKVEPPETGDPIRVIRPGLVTGTRPLNTGLYHANRNKRSLALDLTTLEGHDVLSRLVTGADVFVTNALAPVRHRLRIDVDDIRGVNPDIIYARGSGLGPRAPERDRPGFDFASFWCRGGVANELRSADMEYPPQQPGGNGDVVTGAILAGGICAALLQRERTGVPSIVDCSLLGTAAWMMAHSLTAAASGQRFAAQSLMDRHDLPNPLVNLFATKDGRFIAFVIPQSDRHWPEFCSRTGLDELRDDERFNGAAARREHSGELTLLIESVMATKTLAEWQQQLAGMQAVWETVQTMEELARDPQIIGNQYLQPLDAPEQYQYAPQNVVSAPVQFDVRSYPATPAPAHGEHGAAILLELGYTPEEITALKESRITS